MVRRAPRSILAAAVTPALVPPRSRALPCARRTVHVAQEGSRARVGGGHAHDDRDSEEQDIRPAAESAQRTRTTVAGTDP